MNSCKAEKVIEKISLEYKDRGFLNILKETIEEQYKSTNAGDHFYDDLSKLEDMKSLLERREWGKSDRVDDYFINELIQQIKSSIEHMKNTKST